MFGASFSGDCIFDRAQETTCTSTSGRLLNPCSNASGAVPKYGAARPYSLKCSRLSVVRMATFTAFETPDYVPLAIFPVIWSDPPPSPYGTARDVPATQYTA